MVASSAGTVEAMLTPAVAVSPMRPRAYAQKDSVVKIAWPVKAAGCASVRRIVVVAVGAHGRIYTDPDTDADLRTGRRRQRHKQSCRAGQEQTAHGELMSPARQVLDLPHFVILQNFHVRIESYIGSIAPLLKDNWSIQIVAR